MERGDWPIARKEPIQKLEKNWRMFRSRYVYIWSCWYLWWLQMRKFLVKLWRRSSLRSKIELISKCSIKLISPGRPEHKVKHYDTSSSHIVSSVDRSLENLNTEYLDLLLIHRPDPFMDFHDTAKGLTEVVSQVGQICWSFKFHWLAVSRSLTF